MDFRTVTGEYRVIRVELDFCYLGPEGWSTVDELRKYINSADDYGVFLCFPKKRWTEPYFEKVLALGKEMGFDYMLQEGDFGRHRTPEYLLVDFEKDHHRAYQCVRMILIDTLGVPPNRRYIVYLDGVSQENEQVSS